MTLLLDLCLKLRAGYDKCERINRNVTCVLPTADDTLLLIRPETAQQ